jgi:hypothetical protein
MKKPQPNRRNRTWSDPYTRNFGIVGALLMLVGGVTGLGLIFLSGVWSLALAAVGKEVVEDRSHKRRPLPLGDGEL